MTTALISLMLALPPVTYSVTIADPAEHVAAVEAMFPPRDATPSRS